jgi:hypothetical protein
LGVNPGSAGETADRGVRSGIALSKRQVGLKSRKRPTTVVGKQANGKFRMKIVRTAVIAIVAIVFATGLYLVLTKTGLFAQANPSEKKAAFSNPPIVQATSRPSWRTITLDAKDESLEQVVAEIAGQSGVPTQIDKFPHEKKEINPKTPLTVNFSNTPYWEAVATVSQLFGLGVYTNDPSCKQLSNLEPPMTQHKQVGPITFGLVPDLGPDAKPGAFAVRSLYLRDEVQKEGRETLFFMENGACVGWPIEIKCGQQEKEIRAQGGSVDFNWFSVPQEFRGKPVTISGGFSYSLKERVGTLTVPLKQGGVGRRGDVCIRVTDVIPNGGLEGAGVHLKITDANSKVQRTAIKVII